MESIVAMKKDEFRNEIVIQVSDDRGLILLFESDDRNEVTSYYEDMNTALALTMIRVLLTLTRKNVTEDEKDMYPLLDIMRFSLSEIEKRYDQPIIGLAPDGNQFN